MLALLLASCTPATFNGNQQLKLVAPDIIQYSKETQFMAAKEVEGGSCPALTQFAEDYCVMRDQARILKGEAPICTVAMTQKDGVMKAWLSQAGSTQQTVVK